MDLHGLLKLIVRDLAGKLGASLGERSEASRESAALATADIVALAALADGQVSREELAALERTTIGEGELEVAAVERLYRLEASAEDLASPAWLAVKVADLALALDRAGRAQALRHVARLAAHGARLERASEPPGRPSIRPERALIELFAGALGFEKDEIDTILATSGGASSS